MIMSKIYAKQEGLEIFPKKLSSIHQANQEALYVLKESLHYIHGYLDQQNLLSLMTVAVS